MSRITNRKGARRPAIRPARSRKPRGSRSWCRHLACLFAPAHLGLDAGRKPAPQWVAALLSFRLICHRPSGCVPCSPGFTLEPARNIGAAGFSRLIWTMSVPVKMDIAADELPHRAVKPIRNADMQCVATILAHAAAGTSTKSAAGRCRRRADGVSGCHCVALHCGQRTSRERMYSSHWRSNFSSIGPKTYSNCMSSCSAV